jgi:hypothetical protein
MDRFIHRENLALYRRCWPNQTWRMIRFGTMCFCHLLADEEAKNAIFGPSRFLADRQPEPKAGE